MPFFNSEGATGGNPSNFVDQTDAYANKYNTFISFQHIPTSQRVYFKAMITTFSDSFTSQWSGEEVYGRGDPIQIFKSTKRSLTLGFNIVASTDNEAYQNLAKIQELSQFLYPSYTGTEAQTIAQSPLVRVGFMNIITDNTKGSLSGRSDDVVSETGETFRNADGTLVPVEYSNDSSSGLVCAITSLNYSSMGFESDNSNTVVGKGMVIPRVINVSLSLEPVHRHQLGWVDNSFAKANFPYAVAKSSDSLLAKGDIDYTRDASPISIYKYTGVSDIIDVNGEAVGDGPQPPVPSQGRRGIEIFNHKQMDQFMARAKLYSATAYPLLPEIENLNSGVESINNVFSQLNTRQSEKQKAAQQQALADARYQSLGGKRRLKRDAAGKTSFGALDEKTAREYAAANNINVLEDK